MEPRSSAALQELPCVVLERVLLLSVRVAAAAADEGGDGAAMPRAPAQPALRDALALARSCRALWAAWCECRERVAQLAFEADFLLPCPGYRRCRALVAGERAPAHASAGASDGDGRECTTRDSVYALPLSVLSREDCTVGRDWAASRRLPPGGDALQLYRTSLAARRESLVTALEQFSHSRELFEQRVVPLLPLQAHEALSAQQQIAVVAREARAPAAPAPAPAPAPALATTTTNAAPALATTTTNAASGAAAARHTHLRAPVLSVAALEPGARLAGLQRLRRTGRALFWMRECVLGCLADPDGLSRGRLIVDGFTTLEAVLSEPESAPAPRDLGAEVWAFVAAQTQAMLALLRPGPRTASDAPAVVRDLAALRAVVAAFCPEWSGALRGAQPGYSRLSFFSAFLREKQGIPIVLNSLLCLSLRQLGFSARMTNSPGHVYIRVELESAEVWFADLFFRQVLPRGAIAGFHESALLGVHDIEMVLRSCRNLLQIFLIEGRQDAATLVVLALMTEVAHLAPPSSRNADPPSTSASLSVLFDVYRLGTSRVLRP